MASSAWTGTVAGRVYTIFEQARKIAPNTNAGDGWAEVLSVPPKSPEFLFELGAMARLVAQIRQRVEALPEDVDTETPLEFYPQVEEVAQRFGHLPSINMEGSLKGFEPAGLQSIRFCASTLHAWERPHEIVIDKDRLDALRQAVDELIRDVEESEDLDDQTRQLLLRLLLQVRRALDDYRFRGAAVIESAVSDLVGALVRKPGRWANIVQSRIWAKLGAVLAAVDLALNMWANANQLESAPDAPTSTVVIQIIEERGGMMLPSPRSGAPKQMMITDGTARTTPGNDVDEPPMAEHGAKPS